MTGIIFLLVIIVILHLPFFLKVHNDKEVGRFMKKINCIGSLCMMLIVMLFATSCAARQEPPNILSIEDRFQHNKEDILLVTEYLAHCGYEDFYFQAGGKTALADLTDIAITDTDVVSAVKHLEKQGFYSFGKQGNTVKFMMWKGFIVDIDCGILYSINGRDEPETEYMTKIEPLSERGWYYYVSDFNQWRIENDS